jgi:hypothetical protein
LTLNVTTTDSFPRGATMTPTAPFPRRVGRGEGRNCATRAREVYF